MLYLLVIERAKKNFSGYCPDVPGYGATADSVEELIVVAKEGVAFHLEEESRPPRAHSFGWHLRNGLKLQSTDMVAWLEYEHGKALATA